jgi:hypothetical protein
MKFFDSIYQVIIFIIELLAAAFIFLGGYVLWKAEEFNSFGAGCFIFGSLVVTSFVLDDYCIEFPLSKTIKTVLLVDVLIVLCTLLILITTFGYNIKISEILINDLSSIRILTRNSKLFYWITLTIEDIFGCCRTFDMAST